MEATLYANLNRKSLGEKVEGNAFTWPTLTAGDTVSLRLRFTRRIEGKNQLAPLEIADVYAAVSVVDQRPLAGSYRLKIGPLEEAAVAGTNLTAELLSAATAAQWQTALNALSLCAVEGDYGPATVVEDNGSRIVTFANLAVAGVIVLAENELSPSTLLRVIPIDRDGTIEHDCRLIQAPASMTSTYSIEAGSSPSIERHRPGSDIDGAAINEIQILTIPPDFNGAAEFERVGGDKDGLRSRPFGKTFDLDQFAELLEPLADEDGAFALSNILPNELWIEFTGTMGATPQDLLETHVVRAPQGDCAFTLDLNQPAVYALLRAADNVDAYVHIVVLYEDPETEEMRRWSYLQRVKLQRPVVWNGLDVDEAIDFFRKPGDTHLPVADGQIITGSQHYTRAFPTSLELGASLFTVTHDLGEDFGHIVVGTNSSPGVRLVEGRDYSITIVSEDQFQIQLLAGGYFGTGIVVNDGGTWKFVRTSGGNVESENFLAVAFSSIGPKSAFADHDHYKTDIIGLVDDLTDIFARLAALEAQAASGPAFSLPSRGGGKIEVPLLPVWSVLRSRTLPDPPDSLFGWSPYVGETPLRASRLLPAVHDAEVEALPSTLPAISSVLRGRVFLAGSARPDFPGGGLRVGDHAACDGRAEWYRVYRESDEETSYYPAAFAVELCGLAISESELTPRSAAELMVGFELAMYPDRRNPRDRRSEASMVCYVEIGETTGETEPDPTGENLAEFFANPTIVLAQRILVTATPRQHRFGLRVRRPGSGAITATAIRYRREEACTAPSTANFAVRIRLGAPDCADDSPDPRGLVAIRGLDVGLDGKPDPTLGKLTIS